MMLTQTTNEEPPAKRPRRRITPVPVNAGSSQDGVQLMPPVFMLRRYRNRESTPRFTHVVVDGDKGHYDVFDDSNAIHVTVRESSIPGAGRGVFAAKSFRAKDILGTYAGRVVGWEGGGNATDDASQYLIHHTLYVSRSANATPPRREWRCLVDGSMPAQSESEQRLALNLPIGYDVPFAVSEWPGMFAHLVNDAAGPVRLEGLSNNVIVQDDGAVIATSDIASGAELMFGYGDAYWQQRATV